MSGLDKIFKWLKPRGKVFTNSGTPYAKNIEAFIPSYESRKAAGVLWPGEIENIHAYSSDSSVMELPSFLHLFDAEVLSGAFTEAGFSIERAEMYQRAGLPKYLRLDGRECRCNRGKAQKIAFILST